MVDITRLKTSLLVNYNSTELNEFTSNYIGEVMQGIVRALGKDDDRISMEINETGLRVFASTEEIPMRTEV